MVSSRRRFLGVVGAAGSVGLAGCRVLGDDPPDRLHQYGSHALPTEADWPSLHHDHANSRAIANGGTSLEDPPTVAWRQPVVTLKRHPVVAGDLVIYPDREPPPFSYDRDDDRLLRAFDAATREERWRVTFDAPDESIRGPNVTPVTVTADSQIIVGVTDTQTGVQASVLRAYTMEGALAWETPTPAGGRILAGATYDSDADALYVGTTNERVFRVDAATGSIDWTRQVFGAIDLPLAVDLDEYVYATAGKEVYALDRADGRGIWRTDFDNPLVTPPTVHYYIFLMDRQGTLYALDDDSGTVDWRLQFDTPSSIAIGAYHAYVTPSGLHGPNRLAAVDPQEGSKVWRHTVIGTGRLTAPVVVGDWHSGPSSPVNIYLASGQKVAALRPQTDRLSLEGRRRWSWEADTIDSTNYIRGLVPADERLFVLIKRKTADRDPPPELVALE